MAACVWAGRAGPRLTPGLRRASLVLKTLEQHRPSAGRFNLQERLLRGVRLAHLPTTPNKDLTGLLAVGTPLSDPALAAATSASAVLLGAMGGPERGTGPPRPEQGTPRLARRGRATYGNVRPCFSASEAPVAASPPRADVCRCTDLGSGAVRPGPRWSAWSRARGDARVWSLDRADALAASRLWRRVMTKTFEREFPDVRHEHQLTDSASTKETGEGVAAQLAAILQAS